jgi:hypothetical protein
MKAEAVLYRAVAFLSGPSAWVWRAAGIFGGLVGRRQPFPHIGVIGTPRKRKRGAPTAIERTNNNVNSGINRMNKTKITAIRLPAGASARFYLATAALAVALLAIPHIGHAQGIVRGAQQGAAEGNRAAGPVGGLVGGAVGAGVGGAVGAVKGVLGIPDRGYRRGHRCRGYYDRHDHFHCYR